MLRSTRFLALTVAIVLFAARPALAWPTKFQPPEPTKAVDIARYTGKWIEYARLHNKIEEGCIAADVDYIDHGDKVLATETCRRQPPMPDKLYHAEVKILDPGLNAKLRLTFFPFVYKDYWVLDHAADYSWAIIGEPSGRFLWIFTRQTDIPPAERTLLLERTRALGYDTNKLIYGRAGF